MSISGSTTQAFDQIRAALEASGLPFTLHEHAPSITVRDADQNLNFPVERIVKTIAFRIRNQGILLVGLCGYDLADYRKLAEALGVNRTHLMRLEVDELESELGYTLGGTAPFAPNAHTRVLLDAHVLRHPTVFCGMGRPDRTLEITPADLVLISAASIASVARKLVCEG